MPTPKKGPRFGRDPAHQRLMMANLAASLFAAEAIVTTEAKAKRAEANPDSKLHQIRLVQAYLGDREMTAKLFDEIGPRYADRRPACRRLPGPSP